MRTGKRNWLLAMLVVVAIVFILGTLTNRQSAEAAVVEDTRTAMERYISAYSQYTQAQLDRFKAYRAAIAQSDADAFWSMLVRVTLCTIVVLGGIYGFKLAPVLVARASVVRTSRGDVLLRQNSDGQFVPVPMDKPFEEPSQKTTMTTLPVTHNGETQLIEVRGGKVITVVEDAADFLERAIRVNGSHSKELPRHENMGVSGSKWDAMVHETLGGLFQVDNKGGGVRTYCSQYPDLGTTYYAIVNKKVPLPEKKKAKK